MTSSLVGSEMCIRDSVASSAAPEDQGRNPPTGRASPLTAPSPVCVEPVVFATHLNLPLLKQPQRGATEKSYARDLKRTLLTDLPVQPPAYEMRLDDD
eukprot:12916841-Prorocentrum_lima.AAC.1